jgi:4-hydroxy-2-oxoglutarate aldolase
MNNFKRFLLNLHRNSSTLNKSTDRIHGIIPPICTPFAQDQSVLWKKLELNLAKWEKIGFEGYVVLGSNGEYPFLSEIEKIDLVKAVKSNVNKDKFIIAGAGCECKQQSFYSKLNNFNFKKITLKLF